eukprot:1077509-Prorocentrum_minimum.AAC.1
MLAYWSQTRAKASWFGDPRPRGTIPKKGGRGLTRGRAPGAADRADDVHTVHPAGVDTFSDRHGRALHLRARGHGALHGAV